MSKFKSYAERMDALATETREKVLNAERELSEAEEARNKLAALRGTTPEYLAKMAGAEASLQIARAKRDDLRKILPDMIAREIKSIKAELEKAIDDAFSADPKAIDPATMTLLDSGIMRPAEYQRLLTAAIDDGNSTMARLIGAAAEKASEKVAEKYGNTDEKAQQYRAVSINAQRFGGDVYRQNFEVLEYTLTRCAHNIALWPQWESLTSEIIENGF